MNHSEQVAKKIIERLRPGCNMTFRVHQSNGECDFELFHNHTAVAEVEVTMLTDASMRQTRARIFTAKQGGQFVQGSKCQKGWSVYLTEGADDIKKIRKLVDDYLAPIEASGAERFFFHMDAATSPAICKIFRDLGIEAGCVTKWKPDQHHEDDTRRATACLPCTCLHYQPSRIKNAVRIADSDMPPEHRRTKRPCQ
jgi:hypothetical protein